MECTPKSSDFGKSSTHSTHDAFRSDQKLVRQQDCLMEANNSCYPCCFLNHVIPLLILQVAAPAKLGRVIHECGSVLIKSSRSTQKYSSWFAWWQHDTHSPVHISHSRLDCKANNCKNGT